jgi:hypothetical protein
MSYEKWVNKDYILPITNVLVPSMRWGMKMILWQFAEDWVSFLLENRFQQLSICVSGKSDDEETEL